MKEINREESEKERVNKLVGCTQRGEIDKDRRDRLIAMQTRADDKAREGRKEKQWDGARDKETERESGCDESSSIFLCMLLTGL